MNKELRKDDFITNDVYLFYKLHFILGLSIKEISKGTNISMSCLYGYNRFIKDKYKL